MEKSLYLVAVLKVKEENISFVMSEILKLLPLTKEEKGCISYKLFQDNTDKNVFVLHEHWETFENWQEHLKMPHLINFREATEGRFISKTIHQLSIIE